MSNPNLSFFIWSVADVLRGDYEQSDNNKVILPYTVLRKSGQLIYNTSRVQPGLACDRNGQLHRLQMHQEKPLNFITAKHSRRICVPLD